jgi:hypothetical protein
VVGGLLWWQEFILCGCTSTSENRDEVRSQIVQMIVFLN